MLLYGGSLSVTSYSTPGSPVLTLRTMLTPGVSLSAATTFAWSTDAGTITLVGADDPAGNARLMSSWPCTDSTSDRKSSADVSVVLYDSSPKQQMPSTNAVVTHVARGRLPTRSATRRHQPWVSLLPVDPKRGMNGQNATRPPSSRRAGSAVTITSMATATPMAPMGPRPAVPLTSARLRHSSAAITVPAEATIAGPARRMATRMASCLSSVRLSSSRYLAVSSSA